VGEEKTIMPDSALEERVGDAGDAGEVIDSFACL
jgi:hypothetical protein